MSSKQYDVVQLETPNRNSFDLSHVHNTSMDMGGLYPVTVLEVVPGDNITIGAEALIRFAPLVAPVMHRFDARIEYFFVPNRLVWENWNKFISMQPGAAGIPAFPTVTIDQANYNPLMDHIGIPTPPNALAQETVNAIPFAAYQLIYDQYYRDQNIIPSVPAAYTLVDGSNQAQIAEICSPNRRRAWAHDRFTSCLPFAQKGNPVQIGTSNFTDVPVLVQDTVTGGTSYDWDATANPGGFPRTASVSTGAADPIVGQDSLFADTSQLDNISLTVNELRDAIVLQKWLEINARAGTRINEVIQGHFNITPDDARIQRPEYIVGIKTPISISEVLNTTGETSTTTGQPQGTMAGHGIGAITDPNFGSYFAKEHGFIIGIMSVVPIPTYQQGLEKHWLKTVDITQYFWPTMAHIGEQPVEKKEIYAFQGAPSDPTFGYMPAYYDYRDKPNVTTGQFKSTLSYWTCSRIFATPPLLNADFINCNPRKDIFAVTTEDTLFVQVLHKIFASRLIPQYGTPGLPTI